MNELDSIRLSAIDEALLERLTVVATSDAAADEVTPPLTDDGLWSFERVSWFEEYHRARRLGPNGPLGEATWAILRGSSPIDAVRLQRGDEVGTLEVGIWLARTARGTGAARQALRAVVNETRTWGTRTLVANTKASNVKARALLRAAGFAAEEPTVGGDVRAELRLDLHGPSHTRLTR